MVETLLYFTYYGVVCVAVTPNLLAAAVASNSLYLTMNLFSGFVIPAPVSLCLFFFSFSFFFCLFFFFFFCPCPCPCHCPCPCPSS